MKILFQPYASKSDIKELMGGVRWESACKVFTECKKLENDPFDIRPTKVPSHLVFSILGLDYTFILQQYQQSLLLKEDKRPCN